MKYKLVVFSLLIHWGYAAAQYANQEKQIETIRGAAVKIARMQRVEGNAKAIAEINECWATMKSNSAYDAEVEICLVYDYFISLSTASFYAQLSEAYRTKNNIDVVKIRADSLKRIASAYQHFKLTPTESADAGRLLNEHVFPAALEDRLKTP